MDNFPDAARQLPSSPPKFIYVLSEKWLYYLFRRIQLFLLRKYKKSLTNANRCFTISSIKCEWSDGYEKCEERKSNV
ncbi:MAG: hypothetical protein DBY41_11115 [Clostridium sp.]|nr:MAG: hypothetical protein DBY41_11115 [Clostridium sp.]